MSNVVIYHKNCADGFTAAWVARKFLSSNTEYVAADHDDEPPDVNGKDVYILDFSYSGNRAKLLDIYKRAKSLVVLDHHISAKKSLSDLPFCFFDMNSSGAMMTWQYFSKEIPPLLVSYVEDRDLWSWCLYKSKEFNAYISTRDFTFKEWDKLDLMNFKKITNMGEAVLVYKKQAISRIVKSAHKIKLGQHEVLAANTPILISEVGNELAKLSKFSVIYKFTKDSITYSLRSSSDNPDYMDVSVIATEFGGGGHRCAAGFRSSNIIHEVVK